MWGLVGVIGFMLGLGRGVVSIRVGVGGVCVKMGWYFYWGSCWVVWVGFGVVCWIVASLKTTIHYFFLFNRSIFCPF